MTNITRTKWSISRDSLENYEVSIKHINLLSANFILSAFLVRKQIYSVLAFKISIENISYKIYELIATINLLNRNGPQFNIPIPIKNVFNKSCTEISFETDLDLDQIDIDGFFSLGELAFEVVFSCVERINKKLIDPINVSINDIIKKILKPHKLTDRSVLNEQQTDYLMAATKSVLLDQPSLLHLKGPIILVGDLHGKYFDMLRIFLKFGFPDKVNYLFMGDYVDRGSDSLDIVYLLFALKVRFPENIFLLRGNHECEEITTVSGFKDECDKKQAPYKGIISVFDCLPLSAIISNKIFVVHGGISPHLNSLSQIETIQRPIIFDTDHPVNDMLWSDPNTNIEHYGMSERGPFSIYGQAAALQFLKRFNFELLVRAHEVTANGFAFPFGVDVPVVTLYSSTDSHNGNRGAVMLISERLRYTFDVFKGLDVPGEAQLEKKDFSGLISI
ncbi:Ser/Thr protein phosphatase, putative [Trichomonas vaginalis G3]|uniref:Serine/threonine-protein phosphatase n=1 Tax=Trichomonas vaginalis (strain ATCC PRA-98 / G3) TaxID=412133 RepID=A2EX67_TRIV3|nr:phosphoprotein phosphatase protein [Trichomonas vaginalis G3]EAY02726.1 Ser/Thr protein phosphatase, putative [Trichomonas vaginalis G3]KAI5517267.1 phosphoprotein phosphatase protein [Trichomonas vaginalis G3]|eukprot:XP_001314949.1 Ser/Thr protein phosphatase [Trichomonas vaginalis G3]